MKSSLLIVCLSLALYFFSNSANQHPVVQKKISSENADTVSFETSILPILKNNCSPCHFTGGKMYAKMPFDKPETIMSYEAGISKRFSGKEEAEIIKQFIRLNKS